MNANKLLATAVTTVAFVSFIGLAYAQSTSDGTSPPATSDAPAASTGAEPDSKYVAPSMDASTMPQPSTNSAPAADAGNSANGTTSPTESAPSDGSAPLTERAARTDRN